jgi:hypothetical protein
MKKYFSLLLIVILTASVLSAAGAVTTKKAAAADPAPYVYAVDYTRAPVGTTYTWTAMNGYIADSPRVWNDRPYVGAHSIWIANTHDESVAALLFPECQHGLGYNNYLGVEIRPDPGYGSADWATVQERNVSLTVTVLTTLHTNGQPGHASASASLSTYGTSRQQIDTVYASIGAKDTYFKLQTLRYTALDGQPLKLKDMCYWVETGVGVVIYENGVTSAQSASANVFVQSIKLQFLS